MLNISTKKLNNLNKLSNINPPKWRLILETLLIDAYEI